MNSNSTTSFHVNTARRLFVDDQIVGSRENVTRVLHQVTKHPDNPIFFPCRAWEGIKIKLYGSVIREDDGLFRMWYLAGNSDPEDYQNRSLICYAVSDDGLNWQRPDLGLHEFKGHLANNIVYRSHSDGGKRKARILDVSVIKDPLDPDPTRRYKLINWQYNDEDYYSGDIPFPSGAYAAVSPDGLHWTESPTPLFKFVDSIGDTIYLMHDTIRRRYVAFVKIFLDGDSKMRIQATKDGWCRVDPEGNFHLVDAQAENLRLRQRAIAFSEDFVTWSTPELMFPIDEQDPPDVEHYKNNGFVYESMYLGLLSIYHLSTGCQDFQLISSHDGEHWDRAADRAVFLPSGRPYRDWDFGTASVAGSPPILIGDELWFYYDAQWNIHGQNSPNRYTAEPRGVAGYAIGLAKLRRDGFVSLDAGAEEAMVETKPLILEGDELKINADCTHGELRAEVVDASGDVLAGLSREDCLPVTGDSVGHAVQWQKAQSLSELQRREVRLRFYWQNGALYSFWCEPTAVD